MSDSPPPSTDELFYQRAMRRIYVNMLCLSIAGTVLTAWRVGWVWGLGFLLGATASALNFRWLHETVDAIGPGGKKRGRGLGIVLSLRYVIFGLIGYIVVRYFKIDIMAALVGLFVAVAAVVLEIVYELVYART
ncbi:MAG: hypothetical protein GY953_40400 [bacterium]|nr:hypothetical protein [bacterium]